MVETHPKRVAVIGAGISGVTSAAHLLKHGLDVTLFERSGVAGGVWHFDERSALEPAYPNETPSRGDYETKPELAYLTPPPEATGDKLEEVEIAHAPPGPCYAGLKNNVSTRLMRTSLQAWPEGTPDFVSQKTVEEYVQTIADAHGVSPVAQYNTRVEEVRKQGTEWYVRTTTLQKSPTSFGAPQLAERRWTFDAIVAASGHYHMPRVPDIPGLKDWKREHPDRVWHSKRYRNPAVFKDQNILLIGAGVSSLDIAKESSSTANKIYQSSRGGALDLPANLLPENATRVAGIKEFRLTTAQTADPLKLQPIAGTVVLEDGQELTDIHSVVLCTGYITSYPFLSHLHADTRSAEEADDSVLVTREGEMVHNLHKDIFYIEDPSLAFVGAPYHIATFSLFDFQAQVVARVLAGKALLPPKEVMREEYRQRVKTKGLGRNFHSLRGAGEEQRYVADLVNWMNESAEQLGIEDKMQGHTEEWHKANIDREEQLKWLRATKTQKKEEEVGKELVSA
ncbi:Flavin-containing monooxygenase ustF2 [Exophiala dermatitidis]|uniref:Dimethylaniline monooxygenase (N-oxide forming) n=1 Tax=Exophiala dermatitidis (strain ATCC 34100 / CBS 525.76 / NIH/UT8656) TaxID=858893 RepID=H6C0L0_EXODN|nr:dimethylaniline monooxygenase (N-oxide forming) [Exophiala dermatitidis NIH/UT8656]EHY57252.1 dimethylaniline monooxygenase (N-oxide forming) [Exophiala dermatitidis NIH/UT8656]